MQVKLLSSNAIQPTRGSLNSAGHDLYSAERLTVPAKGQAMVSTDISIALPHGTYGRVAPRSGLALKGLDVGAGVVDSDYRGIIKVILFNHGHKDYMVEKGERIAQIIVTQICLDNFEVVESLDETVRGVDGFGSTGRH